MCVCVCVCVWVAAVSQMNGFLTTVDQLLRMEDASSHTGQLMPPLYALEIAKTCHANSLLTQRPFQ